MTNYSGIIGEAASVRGNERQLAHYVAVIAGLRHSIDDWIHASRMEAFREFLKKHHLHMEVDCAFKSSPQQHVSKDGPPTTRASGHLLADDIEDDNNTEIHVHVAGDSQWAKRAAAAGWYPLAVGGRIINKPFIDSYRLGEAFGYPSCCVQFFMEHNNWARMSHLVDTASHTTHFSYLANSLARSTKYMLTFHIPCAFDCDKTCSYGARLLHAIQKEDKAYADETERFLKQTFLVINERTSFALHNAIKDKELVSFSGVTSLTPRSSYQTTRERSLCGLLEQTDELRINDGNVYLFARGSLTHVIESLCDRTVTEIPAVMSFF